MLTVGKLFQRLSFGPFSNLALGNDGQGDIRTSDQNKVINAINESLTAIYTRFCLLEREVMLRQYAHVTNYHLDRRFALCNEDRLDNHLPYILDLPNEQFSDDALSIIAVFDSVGKRCTLNDEYAPWSLFTPSPTTLQIPNPREGEPVSIQYQANHVRLPYAVKESEIILPLALEPALLSLTAYHIYSAMNTQEATVKATEQFQMYENKCSEVEDKGLASITNANSSKFHRRGFV